jgi:hypothetical protein
MAKPASKQQFVLFDVFYEDGSQRSNRKVPAEILGGLDGDEPARKVIEAQDNEIAKASGRNAAAIESIVRSGAKRR